MIFTFHITIGTIHTKYIHPFIIIIIIIFNVYLRLPKGIRRATIAYLTSV